jgi:hypothetical protein
VSSARGRRGLHPAGGSQPQGGGGRHVGGADTRWGG